MVKKIAILFLSLLVTIFCTEVCLRLAGFEPYQLPGYSFVSEPTNCFGKDSLGVTLLPGKFRVDINNGLIHDVTHGLDSTRLTGSTLPDTLNLPLIHVYGCSYVFGQGVSDSETYPYLLQDALPNARVVNYAVPGHGTLQAFLKLKKNLSTEEAPSLVILNYATFHEERNLLSRSFIDKLYTGFRLMDVEKPKMVYPKISMDKDTFEIQYVNVVDEFTPLPMREWFASINLVDTKLSAVKSEEVLNYNASKTLLSSMADLCSQHDVQLLVTNIDERQDSYVIEDFCSTESIAYVSISPDFSNDSYRNLPFDNHPSALAHKFYADKVVAYLVEQKLEIHSWVTKNQNLLTR